MGKEKYKIAVVDDEALFRNGIEMLINDHEQLSSHIMASDGNDFLHQLNTSPVDLPDALLCDLEMPNMDGVELTKILSEEFPAIKVIVLSSHYEAELILKMIEIGASAFMPKDEETDEFHQTIIHVIEKEFYYNHFIVKSIREKMLFGSKNKKNELMEFTLREKEILALLCQQKTNKEIGAELFISSRTVEGHRKKLLTKTNSKNTAGLIIFAIEQGLHQIDIHKSGW